MIVVSKIYIFPIKSCAGISLKSAEVTPRGLAYDRRWLLVDEVGVHVTQRTKPQLVHFVPTIKESGILLVFKNSEILIPFVPNGDKSNVDVWGSVFEAIEVDIAVSQWFSEHLGQKVRLMYQPDDSIRKVDEKYATSETDHVSAADGYPILMTSEESLDDLNTRLEVPVEMLRFRPNIVVKGMAPYEEDLLRAVKIGNSVLEGVKNCGRCSMITNDLQKGVLSKEPLRTLSSYRNEGGKVNFGRNFIPQNLGEIKIGDHLVD
jgi:uncharacterized protein